MNSERWQKVKEIFNEAVELTADARQVFLDEAAKGDDELRAEVEKLLSFDDDSWATLNRFSVIPPEKIKDQIGNYKISKKIGEGGMGAVYLAERIDVRQRVALKVIRHGADSKILLRRFRHEQEILASLEHPNIARLLNVGINPDGVPYLAMEYVEGEDLLTFARSKNLSVGERLILFRKVCAAVAYAHSRLVVHRDLKPSNIIVNSKGEPKLLDFGISKLLDDAEQESNADGTVTSLGMLTPNYASPEQFRGETVSTATDIYSLGVIFYELLTGRLPYDVNKRRFDEAAKIVCDTNPPRPSEAVSHSIVEATAENKGQTGDNKAETNPKSKIQNPKFLRGDLDNIILKALRKEPERRYSSVEKFSDDVRRHLEGLPVTARPDTFSYRAEKFIRRNRAAVFAGLIIFTTLIGGIAATSWQAIRAERQRALAEKRFDDVRRLANNIVYKYHDEIENLSGATKIREILVSDAIEYLDQLAQDSADDVSLKQELARSYIRIGGLQSGIHGASGIGEISAAIESFKKAVVLLEEAAAKSDDLELLADLRLAYSDLGLAYNRAGKDEKVVYLKKALELSERLANAEPDNLQQQIYLAGDYTNLGDATPNEDSAAINKGEVFFGNNDLYRRGLEMAENILQIEPNNDRALEKTLQAASRLSANYQLAADAYKGFGNEAKKTEAALKALDFAQQAYAVAEKLSVLEPDNADWQYNVSAIRWNESLIQSILGNNKDALKVQSEEIVKIEKAAIDDPKNIDAQHTLAVMYDGLTSTYSNLKDYGEASKYQRKALEIVNLLVSQDAGNLEFKQTRRDIVARAAEIAANEGDTDKAVKVYQTAYQQYIENLPVKEKSAEADYYTGLMNEKIGDAYLKAAEKTGRSHDRRQANSKYAAEHFRATLDYWQKPEVIANFFANDQEQIELVRRKFHNAAEK